MIKNRPEYAETYENAENTKITLGANGLTHSNERILENAK
jgi:hypothetical protein